jgi:hypothetical protein
VPSNQSEIFFVKTQARKKEILNPKLILASQEATGQLLKALLHQAFELREMEEV